MIVTYTIPNCENLKSRIVKKFGHIPKNITVLTYFSFLYRFCLRPIVGDQLRLRGVDWFSDMPAKVPLGKSYRYLTARRFYPARMCQFLSTHGLWDVVQARLKRFYDIFLFDEVQDLAAHDFNGLCALAGADIEILCVGDFFQHTFDTGRDGNTNQNLHKDYDRYVDRLLRAGFTVDRERLNASYRCTSTTCDFISNELGIAMRSAKEGRSEIVELQTNVEIDDALGSPELIKLFYQDHAKYDCSSLNWGLSKGMDDFEDVCVVLNSRTYALYQEKRLNELAPTTRNKLYVAISRANRDVKFVDQSKLKPYRMTHR